MPERKKLLIKLAIGAVLVVVLVSARDYILEYGHRDFVSPLNSLTKRYDCDDGRFLLLYLYTENGKEYAEVGFNDMEEASLTKAEIGGRYTLGKGTLELFEVSGAWQVYQRGEHIFKDCRLASAK